MGKVTTAYLLTCAAIGVATGLLIIPATAFSTATYATMPPVSAIVAGAWVLIGPAALVAPTKYCTIIAPTIGTSSRIATKGRSAAA